MKPTKRNTTISTFLELTLLLWTFYLVLLFAYDDNFFGDRSNTTYFIAFASLAWSLYLFIKLLKIKTMGYAIRYAIPTVIIFWNFVEILGRWDFFKEFWVEPHNYILELSLILIVFLGTLAYAIWDKKKGGLQA